MAKEIVINLAPEANHELGIENVRKFLSNELSKKQLMKLLGYSDVFIEKFKHEDLVNSIIEKAKDGHIKWSDIDNEFEMYGVRICSVCGQPMVAGVYGDGRYYCSDECLDKGLGIENYLELADPDDDNSEYYYTEWN